MSRRVVIERLSVEQHKTYRVLCCAYRDDRKAAREIFAAGLGLLQKALDEHGPPPGSPPREVDTSGDSSGQPEGDPQGDPEGDSEGDSGKGEGPPAATPEDPQAPEADPAKADLPALPGEVRLGDPKDSA